MRTLATVVILGLLVLVPGARASVWHWRISVIGGAGSHGYATAVNNRGEVTGTFVVDGHYPAFVWRGGRTTILGTLPGGIEADPIAINDRGDVVGSSTTHGDGWPHAFLWRDGHMSDLGVLWTRQPGGRKGSGRSWAIAINDRGQIAGNADYRGSQHAFIWENGRMKDLGTLGGGMSVAHALDARGRVVGESMTADHRMHAFVWEGGRMRDLGTLGGGGRTSAALAINARGAIVGQAGGRDGELHACLWNDDKPRDIGGYEMLTALAVNRAGVVVGTGGDRAYRWFDGKRVDLESLGGDRTTFETFGASTVGIINVGGDIVGASATGSGAMHAFIWGANGMHDLGTFPGDDESAAAAINDHDLVVGYSQQGATTRPVVWTKRA